MWVEETKNGKYKFIERYTDYLTDKIKRVSVTMDRNTPQSRKIAQKALDAKIDKAIQAKRKNSITLKELVISYQESQKLTVKASTYTRNAYACKSLLKILGESIIVDRITAAYVKERFLHSGRDNGTLNEFLKRYKALIRWGYHNDLIENISYLDKIERFSDISHKEKIQDKYLEFSELKTLITGMTEERWILLTEFLALSGLRFGEAAALLKEDVDIKNNFIHVTKTFDSINLVTTSPKTLCSNRDVYIQPELSAICRSIRAYMLRQSLRYGYEPTELFLADITGKHIPYYTYNKYLRENSLRLVGRAITPHALRHTHASLLLENGINIETISRRLGHEDSKITKEIYLHITERLKEKDNEQISKVNLM